MCKPDNHNCGELMQYHRKLRNIWLPFSLVFCTKMGNFIQVGRVKIIIAICKVETFSIKHCIWTCKPTSCFIN